jgi:hypothetical protein
MSRLITTMLFHHLRLRLASLLDTSLENHGLGRLAGDDQEGIAESLDYNRGNKLQSVHSFHASEPRPRERALSGCPILKGPSCYVEYEFVPRGSFLFYYTLVAKSIA